MLSSCNNKKFHRNMHILCLFCVVKSTKVSCMNLCPCERCAVWRCEDRRFLLVSWESKLCAKGV
jgi:hypothetical protein